MKCRSSSSRFFRIQELLRSSVTVGAICLAIGMSINQAQAGVKVGVLECTLGVGVGVVIVENQKVECTFTPNVGAVEHYGGQITKIGLELGITGGTVVVWGVIAATNDYAPGSLAGAYGGATAEATAILGVGANALWGGSDQSLALQPISVQGQVGVDIGIGLSGMTLVQM
jgi:Protein of unknown function (DUF992)